MKKILLTGIMVLALGACTSTQTDDATKISRDRESSWAEEAGNIDNEEWWMVNDYSDDAE